jgi:hypothetical protein
MLSCTNLKEKWHEKRERMLSEKIDVTSFWTWFIDNYPKSPNLLENQLDFFSHFNRQVK